ncbi:MAG: EndoU domain-containing protein [Fluviicola sp.]|nr:EndoU domain-containing protein [Fluviicola sp.]
MENQWLYFITDDYMSSASNSDNDLSPGPRIFKTPLDFLIKFSRGDGPYKSLRSLKRNSTIYKELSRSNSRRIQQILKDKNIVEFTNNLIPYPRNKGIPQDMLRMITHSTNGLITKGKISGIHFYDPEKVRIVEELDFDEKSEVWEAVIEFYDKKKDVWRLKDNPSTFFPKKWTVQQLFYECMHALEDSDMQLVRGAEHKYKSQTLSGIHVYIIKKNNLLKTIYPIIQRQ